MARTKIDDILISALGVRRTELARQIDELQSRPTLLAELQTELLDVESKLKSIDPTIPALDQELSLVAEAEPLSVK